MKKITTLLFLSFCLFACKQNNGQPAEISGTQHDTVKVEGAAGVLAKDSIISDGEYIQHYKNGVTKMRGMMKNGKREGLWKSFYENGSPWSETTFKEGKKEGRTTTWYVNEKKRYDGFYSNDSESGKWVFWNEKGEQVQQMDYGKK